MDTLVFVGVALVLLWVFVAWFARATDPTRPETYKTWQRAQEGRRLKLDQKQNVTEKTVEKRYM